MKLIAVFYLLLPAVLLAGCAPKILQKIPDGGVIPFKDIVYVENDGRCSTGEVIRIRGGSNKKNVPREYSCVDRPE